MVSKTSIKYLQDLRTALLCPYEDCESETRMMENTVTLPCGHHFCYDCAIDSIDRYDGCTVCNFPCWGKDAKSNHTMNRMIEQVQKLSQLALAIQKYEQLPLPSTTTNDNHHKGKNDSVNENDNLSILPLPSTEYTNDINLSVLNNQYMDRNRTNGTPPTTATDDDADDHSGAQFQPSHVPALIQSPVKILQNENHTDEYDDEEDDIVHPSHRKRSRSIGSLSNNNTLSSTTVVSSTFSSSEFPSITPGQQKGVSYAVGPSKDDGEDILSANSTESLPSNDTIQANRVVIHSIPSVTISPGSLGIIGGGGGVSVTSTVFSPLNTDTSSTTLTAMNNNHIIMPPPPPRRSTLSSAKGKISPRTSHSSSSVLSLGGTVSASSSSSSKTLDTAVEENTLSSAVNVYSTASKQLNSNTHLYQPIINPQISIVQNRNTIETDDEEDTEGKKKEEEEEEEDGPVPIQRRRKPLLLTSSASTVNTNVPVQNKENNGVKLLTKIPKPLVTESTSSTVPLTLTNGNSSHPSKTIVVNTNTPALSMVTSLVSISSTSTGTYPPPPSTSVTPRHTPRALDLVPSSSSSAEAVVKHTAKLNSENTVPNRIVDEVPYQPIYGSGGANRARQTGQIVICPTGITTDEERKIMVTLGRILQCTIVDKFDPSTVTHIVTVVTTTDTTGPPDHRPICSRTLKYVQGLLCGCWIVSFEWARKCASLGTYIDESIYEIARDRSARKNCTSPLLYRRWTLENRLPLFYNQHFYILEPLHRLNIAELSLCIQCGGGILETIDPVQQYANIMKENKKFDDANNDSTSIAHRNQATYNDEELNRIRNIIVITSFDSSLRDTSNLLKLEKMYHQTLNVQVVDQLWFLDCVSNGTLEEISKWTFGGEGIKTLRKKVTSNK